MVDKYIQALVALECAYRGLLNASKELPFADSLVEKVDKLREKVRALEVEAMNKAIVFDAKEIRIG